MRISLIFDQPKWVIGKVGAFEHRYGQICSSLTQSGHEITYIYLSYGQLPIPKELDVLHPKIVGMSVPPNTKIAQLKAILLDFIRPRRVLPHDREMNLILKQSRPDAVITLMQSNPKLIRNLTPEFPSIHFAEEDFSIGLDKTAGEHGKFLRPLVRIRNRIRQRSLPRPDTVIVISEPEIAWAKRAYPGAHIATIPLFLPEEFWLETVEAEAEITDIFAVGRFDAVRNAYGLKKFVEELKIQRPIDTPTVRIACWYQPHSILHELLGKGLDYLGNVLDTRPYYRAAKICVVPAFSVSGAKNQVLQGWTSECAVVAATQSALSVNGIDGKDLLTGDNPKELASAALSALDDPRLREHLRINGMNSYLQRHSRKYALSLFADELVFTVARRSN